MGGTVTAAGLYQAPAAQGIYHLVVTSKADPTKSASALISVSSSNGINIQITRSYAILAPKMSQSFQCIVQGTSDNKCKWSVLEGEAGGKVKSDSPVQGLSVGTYTAPATLGTYHVVASANADPGKIALVEVAVRTVSAGSCENPGAVGRWEEITPPNIALPGILTCDYGVQTVRVDPKDPRIVYAGTCQYGIMKSVDCGSTWTHANEGKLGIHLDSGRQWAFIIDPVNTRTIYTNSGYNGYDSGHNGIYRSDDGGTNWKEIWPPRDGSYATMVPYNFAAQVNMDPTDPGHLLLGFHQVCNWPGVTSMCYVESKDRGEHWTVHNADPRWQASESQTPYMINATTWLFANHDSASSVWVSSNSGSSWEKIGDKSAGHWPGQPYNASNGNWYLGTDSGVLRSTDGGLHWKYVPNWSGQITVGLTGDGTDMWATNFGALTPWVSPGTPVYVTSRESDGLMWTPARWDTSGIPFKGFTQGAQILAVDPVRHLLYGAHGTQGLYRIRYK